MPDEQATRSAARCQAHPSSPSIALCDSCGRPLCLRCAVPVRGQVFGPECLAAVLGPDGGTGPRAVPGRPRNVVFGLLGVALLGAVVGSILPWTRFGDPSGLFGGWGINPQRWSSLSTYSAAVALGLWTWWRLRRGEATRAGGAVLLALSAASIAGAILHILNPPPFTHAWLGPWITLGWAIAAALVAGILLVREGGPKGANRSAP